MHVLNRRPARHLTTGGVRWVGPVVVLLAVLGLVLAPTPASPGADAAGAVAAAGVPPRFAGTVDEFYVVPSPLPAGAPGELLRVQDVSSGGGTTTVRIMYHSVDAAGRDRAVTGIVTYPDGPAPVGGWPVVSLAPGTSGLAAPCATSRSGAPAPVFGVPAVGVRTGLNLVTLFAILAQPFIPDAAKTVLDAMGVPEANRTWPKPDDAGLLDALPHGHAFTPPDVLFKKIEDVDLAAWTERFGGGA